MVRTIPNLLMGILFFVYDFLPHSPDSGMPLYPMYMHILIHCDNATVVIHIIIMHAQARTAVGGAGVALVIFPNILNR